MLCKAQLITFTTTRCKPLGGVAPKGLLTSGGRDLDATTFFLNVPFLLLDCRIANLEQFEEPGFNPLWSTLKSEKNYLGLVALCDFIQ